MQRLRRCESKFGKLLQGQLKGCDFSGWPRVYENDPYKIAELHGIQLDEETKKQILGGEASLMGHQVGEMISIITS